MDNNFNEWYVDKALFHPPSDTSGGVAKGICRRMIKISDLELDILGEVLKAVL